MTGQTTTTIETLTAEVRALMIGKRQVTLSVYRQLDTIPWSEIEPFGRVRDSKDDEYAINVIGRNRENNALVRSAIRRDSWLEPAPEQFSHWLFHRGTADKRAIVFPVGASHGRTLQWSIQRTKHYPGTICGFTCDAASRHELDHNARQAGEFCDLDRLEAEWRWFADNRVDTLIPRELEFQAAERLPLIVLAGLR